MARTPSLFPPPRRRLGPYETALGTVLRAWRKSEHLTGDTHAAQRSILRGLARLADSATTGNEAGDVTEYAAAVVVNHYRQALADYAPPPADHTAAAGDQITRAALHILDSYADGS